MIEPAARPPRRRRVRRWATRVCAAAIASAAALALSAHTAFAACPLPGELSEHCDDPKEMLPMWRWTGATRVWSDWGGGFFDGWYKSLGGLIYDSAVRILFVIASMIWQALAELLYLALSQDFGDEMATGINDIYHQVAVSLWNSGTIILIASLSFAWAVWLLYRRGGQEAFRSVAKTMLCLGLLMSMLFALRTDPSSDIASWDPVDGDEIGSGGKPQPSPRGTPRWLYDSVVGIGDLFAASFTDVARGLSTPATAHGSYCSAYTLQLERLYLAATEEKRRTDAADHGGSGELQAKDYTPIFLSRLWERAYLAPWSRAQYGSPQSAYNGSCLWAEVNSGGVTAPEIMAVWTTTCDPAFISRYSGANAFGREVVENRRSVLYGCAGATAAGGVPLPVSSPGVEYDHDERNRGWKAFGPDGDGETRAFLNLTSGCGLINPDYTKPIGDTAPDPDGAPQIPGTMLPVLPTGRDGGWGTGSLLVQDGNSYLEAGRIGMRSDKGFDEGEWFSLDVCHVWLTGADIQSGVDENHGELGIGLISGEHQGLNSSYAVERSKITCEDAEVAAKQVTESMSDTGYGTVTNPEQAIAAREDICTFAGQRFWTRMINAFIVIGTALSFAFSLIGMSFGTALAQVMLALVFMSLPLTLAIAAIPARATQKILTTVAKFALFATLAHTFFLLILTMLVFLIDVLVVAVVESTDPGSWVRILTLAIVPFAAKKILSKAAKRFGLDFSSIKGGLRVTSGLAMAAIGSNQSGLESQASRYGRNKIRDAYYARESFRQDRGAAMTPRAASSGGSDSPAAGSSGAPAESAPSEGAADTAGPSAEPGSVNDTRGAAAGPDPSAEQGSVNDTRGAAAGPDPSAEQGSVNDTRGAAAGPDPSAEQGSVNDTRGAAAGPDPSAEQGSVNDTRGAAAGPDPSAEQGSVNDTRGAAAGPDPSGSPDSVDVDAAQAGDGGVDPDSPHKEAGGPDTSGGAPQPAPAAAGEGSFVDGVGEPGADPDAKHSESPEEAVRKATAEGGGKSLLGRFKRGESRARIAGEVLQGTAKWVKDHRAFAVGALGVMAGAGLAAPALMYLGGKAIKYATVGPRKMIRRKYETVRNRNREGYDKMNQRFDRWFPDANLPELKFKKRAKDGLDNLWKRMPLPGRDRDAAQPRPSTDATQDATPDFRPGPDAAQPPPSTDATQDATPDVRPGPDAAQPPPSTDATQDATPDVRPGPDAAQPPPSTDATQDATPDVRPGPDAAQPPPDTDATQDATPDFRPGPDAAQPPPDTGPPPDDSGSDAQSPPDTGVPPDSDDASRPSPEPAHGDEGASQQASATAWPNQTSAGGHTRVQRWWEDTQALAPAAESLGIERPNLPADPAQWSPEHYQMGIDWAASVEDKTFSLRQQVAASVVSPGNSGDRTAPTGTVRERVEAARSASTTVQQLHKMAGEKGEEGKKGMEPSVLVRMAMLANPNINSAVVGKLVVDGDVRVAAMARDHPLCSTDVALPPTGRAR